MTGSAPGPNPYRLPFTRDEYVAAQLPVRPRAQAEEQANRLFTRDPNLIGITVMDGDNAYRVGYGPASGPATWLPTVENTTSASQIFSCGSGPEAYTFNPGVADYLYIVAYSDKGATQGVLGTFRLAGGQTVNTGPAWQVFATNQNVNVNTGGVGDPQANSAIAQANSTNGWRGMVNTSGTVPGLAVGENNSAGGLFPLTCNTGATAIPTAAQWMWYTSRPPSNAFNTNPGPGGHGEFLLFRLPVRALMCTCPRVNPRDAVDAVDNAVTRGLDVRAVPADTPASQPRPRP